MVKYILLLFFSLQLLAQQEEVLSWYTIDPRTGETVELGEEGSIQFAYLKKNLLPNPFVAENEAAYYWLEDYEWELYSTFTLGDSLNNYFFTCDWIDTYCSIFINDVLVYTAENAFLPHTLEITQFLKKGENKIVAVFTPPVLYHKDKKQDFTYPAPNDISTVKTASLTRKPQYQFGWDWAPRINTLGFISPVRIKKNPKPLINHYQVVLYNFDGENASTDFIIECDALENQSVTWESKLFGAHQTSVEKGVVTRPQLIKDAKLWMPNNLGESYVYTDTWVIKDINGKELTRKKVRFGLKTSRLIYEEDSVGKAYYFLVNGEKVFCKGANYIPQDIFPSRVTEKEIQDMVLSMAEANFNMIRVWGGGYYPIDRFYEMCDSLGIMVWQDFMFACAMYPGAENFLLNIEKEAVFQVKRLAKHPSIVLFNGNNEVDVAWKNWGFQKEYELDSTAQEIIAMAYDEIFKKCLPKVVSENSEVSYIHTSPLSNWGKPAYFDNGTMHYWGVWHGKDPIEALWEKTGRFNAEYGFQSFPNISTINSFASKEEQSLSSETMKNHQKSYVGNQMIEKHSNLLFGSSLSFEDFVYKSQLTQAFAIGNAILAHRLDFPRCMGTLFWQFNDCWPAPTWSSLDFYKNKKALHYAVEKNFASICVGQDPQGELGEFWIINDTKKEGYVAVELEVFKLNGKQRFKTDLGLFFKSGEYKKSAFFSAVSKLNEYKSYLLIIRWKDAKGKFYEKRILKEGRSKVSQLNEESIKILESSYDDKTRKGSIEIELPKFAQNFWLASKSQHVNFSSNFLHLEKGVHTFHYSFDEEIDLNELQFFYLNK